MAGVFVAPSAADAADSITVYVRDDGFSQTNIEAREGDRLIFVLDAGARLDHSIAWERGYFEFHFRRPDRASKAYPEEPGRGLNAGPTAIHFYDSSQLRGPGPHPPGPFSGTLTVTKAPVTPPPPTPSSSTTTTAPPTTVTTAPTTTTSAPTSIRPHLVPDPPPTTTTTAAPTPPTTANNRAPAPPPSAKKGNKDKDKSKPASPETTATTVPPPSDTAWIDSLLGTASLTPSPALLDQPAVDSAGEMAIDAAEIASLLEKPASDGDDNKLLLMGLAAVAVLLLAVATSAWFTRSSRYDPA